MGNCHSRCQIIQVSIAFWVMIEAVVMDLTHECCKNRSNHPSRNKVEQLPETANQILALISQRSL